MKTLLPNICARGVKHVEEDFTSEDLKAIADKASGLAAKARNPWWKRHYTQLADAAHVMWMHRQVYAGGRNEP